MAGKDPTTTRENRFIEAGVILIACLIAVLSAHWYAGAWNDGSRLATVESLVDRHTLAIDDSIFVRVPPSGPLPYSPDEPLLLEHGTGDKLLIDGHYYSDKSPVPALFMAGIYQALQSTAGLSAQTQTDRFCYVMTLCSSGLAYVVAVYCVYRMGRPLRLPTSLCLLLTASFALATVALPYAQFANNHILFLAVTAFMMLTLAGIETLPPLRLGTLAGLGYTFDLGAGPVLLVCAFALVAWRCRHWKPVLWFGLAAIPWLVLHHTINYATGGTFKPANAVAEYLDWPGSSFNSQNMTGVVNHTLGHFLTYAAALLFGKRGFVGHNLALFLVVPAVVQLIRRRIREWPEVAFAVAWCGGTWLAYALTSNNYSGLCCSIRWFVPFLAPAYFVLAIFLREQPRFAGDFAILSLWGAVLAVIMAWQGPWMKHLVPFFWPIQGLALLNWLGYRFWQRRRARQADLAVSFLPSLSNAA